MLGNDVSQLRRTIEPNRKLLAAWRAKALPVMHTREGHRPDLSDLPPAKKIRGRGKTTHRRCRADGAHSRPRRGRARHHPRALPAAVGAGDRQARQRRVLRHRPARHPAEPRHHTTHRDRRDDRGVREHHRARGQRPRLRLPRAGGLRRLLFPGVPDDGSEDDQGAGRHLRLGLALGQAFSRRSLEPGSRSDDSRETRPCQS